MSQISYLPHPEDPSLISIHSKQSSKSSVYDVHTKLSSKVEVIDIFRSFEPLKVFKNSNFNGFENFKRFEPHF